MADPTGRVSPQNYAPGEWADALPPTSLLGTASPQNYIPDSTLIADVIAGSASPSTEMEDDFLGWRQDEGPIVENQDPAPLETGVSLSKDISFDVIDNQENIYLTTARIWVDGNLIYDGSTDSFLLDFTSSTRTVISQGYHFNLHSDVGWASTSTVTPRIYAEDASGNPVDVSWNFTTLTALALISATPTSYTTITVSYSKPMVVGPFGSTESAVNPYNYTILGGNGLTITGISIVSTSVFLFTVVGMRHGVTYTVVAAGTVKSAGGETIAQALLIDPLADRKSFVGTADLPRLVQVTNPSVGVLNVEFSKSMLQNVPLKTIETYQVEGLGIAKPLFITGVTVSQETPSRVTLSYTGGGSLYRMTVTGVHGALLNPIDLDHNSAVFELLYPTIDELFSGDQVYMDTNLGAIQLTYNTLSRRRIEDLVIVRARSIGNNAQFQLVVDSLKDAGINRDDTRLKLFKG